ncbi:A24 family peptidase [Amycolatopsis keratiniphila]|uniref:Leader peptidase (Prepilin peptidase) / N-methyltransferase n=1 Tax=Amycolatopsis keratiniphila TaxID=129921 RepID=R4SP44_9PSEU|nr:A24 family peptidase [Amycolatopsis keratiniphila]AGM05314.1 leader peptidase (prepilin peptidase) / N-methyltransferase [Amycolatopsis keratiniphila]
MFTPIAFAVAGAGSALVTRPCLRRAGAPITAWAAALTAVALVAVCLRYQSGAWPSWWLAVPAVLTVFAVPLALADLKYRRLPDILTLPAYPALAVALGIAAHGGGAAITWRAVLGALVFGGAHALVHAVSPRSLGAGDVKLAGSLGAVLAATGWPSIVLGAVAAALLSVALAVGGPRHPTVPHGPGLLVAAWALAVFAGPGPG